MNLIYSITIYGEPVAQGRARSRIINTKSASFVSHYDPAKSRNYKELVRNQILINGRPEKLIDEPLAMTCKVYRSRPKSKPKKVIYPSTKPDLDNYLKSIKDAMSGLVYSDDSLIVSYRHIWKLYDSDSPRVEIYLYSLEGESI